MPSNRGKNHRLGKNDQKLVFEKKWQNLSPEQQLKSIDQRLGTGIGATKQRQQIQEKLKYLDEANEKILKLFKKQKLNNKNNDKNK